MQLETDHLAKPGWGKALTVCPYRGSRRPKDGKVRQETCGPLEKMVELSGVEPLTSCMP